MTSGMFFFADLRIYRTGIFFMKVFSLSGNFLFIALKTLVTYTRELNAGVQESFRKYSIIPIGEIFQR